jgi:hypothetical protein
MHAIQGLRGPLACLAIKQALAAEDSRASQAYETSHTYTAVPLVLRHPPNSNPTSTSPQLAVLSSSLLTGLHLNVADRHPYTAFIPSSDRPIASSSHRTANCGVPYCTAQRITDMHDAWCCAAIYVSEIPRVSW